MFVFYLLYKVDKSNVGVRNADKDNDYDVKVTGLEISPFPVKRGRETSFSISAQTGKILFLETFLFVVC